MSSSSVVNSISVSESYDGQQTKREGLTDKFRQKMQAVGKGGQTPRQARVSQPDLSYLTERSQELILRAVDTIKKEDSENVMNALDESRDILRDSFTEFKREQEEYRKQLQEITKIKEAALGRSKENAIPLSILLRQKNNPERLADVRSNSSMNDTYQAYFEALLSPEPNDPQHPTDKAAVVKYIRRRERRKRAEENKKNHQLSDDILEKQAAELLQKMEGMDIKLESERQRQNERLRAKMDEKKRQINQANEILGQANEADLARQRVEQTQREKFEERLSAVRNQQKQKSSNMIYVQSHMNEDDDQKLNDEQMEKNKQSLQLLNENDDYRQSHSTTPIYGDGNTDDKIANIHI